MKDLDFDELDRAVNSLIAKTPGGSGADSSAVSLVTPDPANDPNLIPTTPVSAGLPTVPVIAPMPVVERPSTGRFMDVVHPSSDMRTSLMMPDRSPRPVMAPPVMKPIVPTPVSAPAPTEISWPDPIDFQGNNNKPAEEKDDDSDIDQISNDIAKSMGQTQNDPLESPFLSGAKVEKRPLGAFSDGPITSPSMSAVASTPMPQPGQMNGPKNDDPEDVNTPLPAELQNDLLSIESDSTTQTVKPAEPIVPASVSRPVAYTPIPTPIIAAPAISAPAQATIVAPVSAAVSTSTSIQPQYKEQPSTGDQKNGAIYDTKTYNKPMVRPTKKKSGWMWIIWIVIFLIVGAGVGAAVYFLVLPNL
jgi:hypothetical protein